jgi:ATP-binding cassette, subfamily B (MDR/TAP), member 1
VSVFNILFFAFFNFEQKMFMTGFSGDLEAAHAKATQLAGEAIANVRTVAAFNSEKKIVGLFASNLETPLRHCFWKGQISGRADME